MSVLGSGSFEQLQLGVAGKEILPSFRVPFPEDIEE